jgi:dolichol-phosphate mannosyltransferase
VQLGKAQFVLAQTIATLTAITWNFILNNAITYRDRRLTGWRFWAGLLGFQLICGIGAVSNIGIASLLYGADERWWVAGILGALIGTAWNYMVSAAFIWRL